MKLQNPIASCTFSTGCVFVLILYIPTQGSSHTDTMERSFKILKLVPAWALYTTQTTARVP